MRYKKSHSKSQSYWVNDNLKHISGITSETYRKKKRKNYQALFKAFHFHIVFIGSGTNECSHSLSYKKDAGFLEVLQRTPYKYLYPILWVWLEILITISKTY